MYILIAVTKQAIIVESVLAKIYCMNLHINAQFIDITYILQNFPTLPN